MEHVLKGIYRAFKPEASPIVVGDDADFADYAKAPDPSPASNIPSIAVAPSEQQAIPTSSTGITYTKWYRVWERTSPSDFYQEALILPVIIFLIGLHIWGRRKNKRKAKSWITAHAPLLEKEFAVVGFGGRKPPTVDQVQADGLLKAIAAEESLIPSELLREKTAMEYTTYATGRQNVAFMDVKISLFKRYNPMTLMLESALSFFFDSMRAPAERMEATAYAFDGKEKDLIPVPNKREQENLEVRVRGIQSSYDGFVWAIVNKDGMRQLREDRYDLSLTSTKDHPKLPPWASVMSESSEITDVLLTHDLIKAIQQAGNATFEYLIVTDQPLNKPQKLNETVPRKRLSLALRLPSSSSPSAYEATLPLFGNFLRLPDNLVTSAHFRPEVLRKIRNIREDEIKKLKKFDDEEKAEERKLEGDRKKKAERDMKLKGMGAEEQRKFLEKEREKGQRKQGKKMTKKG